LTGFDESEAEDAWQWGWGAGGSAVNKVSKRYRKTLFYLSNGVNLLVPDVFFRRQLQARLRSPLAHSPEVVARVDYYNQLSDPFDPGEAGIRLSQLRPGKQNTYYFDLRRVARYFDQDLRLAHLFGDVTTVPGTPTLVKSRPIQEGNENSVLMKLNQVRHFYFVRDEVPFEKKRNVAVWRGNCKMNPARRRLVERHFSTPVCDVGESKEENRPLGNFKGFLSIREQLNYKFILSIEGNDVATNLKWIMSSNSLCFMPRARYETWFMEGKLVPGKHFVLLKDDYSDLEEKVDFYSSDLGAAQEIVHNANQYVEPFKNHRQEELISILVMEKYFRLSNQL
jgi:hypothetical protein